ncbi:hypothetical protein QFC22_000501 [Naganishia vaughanmartiniae]|uniref:Uncharacterized protein n=1 Tax=Naganishia vaughanmartiniae TaxID=1424756 RepID=A0ACC2XPK0_9TREE|nr:hypothetical protein QFC22_000501 [Naganishia vaughanmartiniae]
MWRSSQANKPKPLKLVQPAFTSYSPNILQPTPLQTTTSSTLDPLIGSLPLSVFTRILSYLPVPDIPNVARTCRILARVVRTDERVWNARCVVLGLLDNSAQDGQDNAKIQNRRKQSITTTRNGHPPITAAPINLNDDDFGDFASQPLSAISDRNATSGTGAADDEFEDVFGDFTSAGVPAISSTTQAQRLASPRKDDGVSLLDIDFEEGNNVPLPSTLATSKKTPQKATLQKRTTGFFAVNPAVLSSPSSGRPSGTSKDGSCHAYNTYKEQHIRLTPYVKVLRSCSTANSSTITSSISASQALSLLFPPTQNGPAPLDVQASVLADLLSFLSAAVEPTRDWGWLRRVLGGVCDRFESVCLNAFDRAEKLAESTTNSPFSPAQSMNTTDSATTALRLVAEASWDVYRTTRETEPREKRYRPYAKDSVFTTSAKFGSSNATFVQEFIHDQSEWELGRAWVEKREVFYEGNKWDSTKNIVWVASAQSIIRDELTSPYYSKVAQSQSGKTHRLDFTPMNDFISHVLAAVNQDGAVITKVFPGMAGLIVIYKFTDRLANDVVAEYINPLLSECRLLSQELFLTATPATFVESWRVVEKMAEVAKKLIPDGAEKVEGGIAPVSLDYSRLLGQVVYVVTQVSPMTLQYDMFEVNMDEYLEEEIEHVKSSLNSICVAWDQQSGPSTGSTAKPEARSTFLSSSNPDQVKRNVLAGFRDVLLLPVTIVPLTVSYGVNAIVTGGTQAVNGLSMLNPQKWGGQTAATTPVVEATGGQSKDTDVVADDNADTEAELPSVMVQPVDVDQVWASEKSDVSSLKNESLQSSTTPSKADPRFSQMQLLLSLDIILELIHADRESLKRIETFKDYTGKYGRKVKDAIEEVFVLLLRAVGDRHIAPGFQKAIDQMGTYKPEKGDDATSVAPLLQFFELVHIGDTIQSMVQVYFDKELAAYIDKTDFLNGAMQQKKKFEATLDESVAAGLNAGIEVLMNQVEHIIQTETIPGQYCPPAGQDLELGPTKGCEDAIKCLELHCTLLQGSASKEVLEVFYQEVGIRLQAILQRHIKRQIISLEGGFQMISDLNAYYAFVASLKQPRITEDFSNLKMIGHVYIVADAKDLAQIVRDVARYGATFRPEE